MKENFIFVIRSSAGEVEWIMPFWFFLKERDINFLIIFETRQSFVSLQENRELHNLWEKNFTEQSYFPYKKSLIYQLLDKASNFTVFQNSRYRITLEKLLSYFSLEIQYKRLYRYLEGKFDISENFFLFKDYNGLSPLSRYLEKKFLNLTVIFLPHSNHIFSNSGSNKENRKKIIKKHHLLISNESDKEIFEKNLSVDTVTNVGFTFTDDLWTEKILHEDDNRDIKEKTRNVLLISRAIHPTYLSHDDKVRYLNWILEACSNYEEINLFIKPHPREKNENNIIEDLRSLYKKVNIFIVSESLLKVCSEMDLVISFWSSGVLQAKYHEKPVIELYDPKERKEDCVYDENGEITTIYRKLGLAEGVSSKQGFADLFDLGINQPNSEIWLRQNDAFRNLEGVTTNSSEKIYATLQDISKLNNLDANG